jgi:3-deoxy-D-manno-octulosonate 8-phosphate phosphatase (KDO 8-P phosphatase)
VRDGFAIRVWQRLGFTVAIVTGRSGEALRHRMTELGVAHVIQGSVDKAASLEVLGAKTGIAPSGTAYLGDDWPDLPILRRVGYPMAVADADEEVRKAAAFVTRAPGGRGAVREAVEHLVRAKGLMARALAMYDGSHGG